MSDLIDRTDLRGRADALRAVKYLPPLAGDSSYGLTYTRGLTGLVTPLFTALGADLDAIADTLRGAGITGDPADYQDNVVSHWLRHLLGPGYYVYGADGYVVDLA